MTRALLHDYFRSSAAYRVRIALNLKGVDYDRQPVNLVEGAQKSEAYRALNPQGLVPMLEIDGLKLTGFFLERHVFGPRGVAAPEARHWIAAHLAEVLKT